MTKKENFTAGRVESFECEPGKRQSFYWDAKAPGLGIRVTPSGAKSYIFETRLHGKTIRITIGDAKAWTIGKAQTEAYRLKTLTDQGMDPREQKAEQRAQAEARKAETKRQGLTLGDLWPLYLEAHKAKWSERHYRSHVQLAAKGGEPRKRSDELTTAGPLAALLPLQLPELTSDRISSWLDKESAERPSSAALSYRLLRACIRWASGEKAYSGLIPNEAYSAKKVRAAVPRTRAKEGDCLQREQLPAWFEAVRKIHNPVISVYLQALLLTGARREEMASLKWEDVDFQWRSLKIRDKVEGQRIIPLPPYLASLLSMLHRRNPGVTQTKPKRNPDETQWVFSSPTAAGGKITEPRIAHNNALTAAGLPHVSLHGLRRSFGTLCEWVEMPSGISAQIMGHKPSALAEKHYRRRPLDLLRMWHDKIEAWMLDQAGIKFDPEQAKPGLRVVA